MKDQNESKVEDVRREAEVRKTVRPMTSPCPERSGVRRIRCGGGYRILRGKARPDSY